ncbi:uncharacterized protein J3R85_004778 [Psidium guajava]|nr:uncharacterized protein J3R85_004778 [Psidium guajava]
MGLELAKLSELEVCQVCLRSLDLAEAIGDPQGCRIYWPKPRAYRGHQIRQPQGSLIASAKSSSLEVAKSEALRLVGTCKLDRRPRVRLTTRLTASSEAGRDW